MEKNEYIVMLMYADKPKGFCKCKSVLTDSEEKAQDLFKRGKKKVMVRFNGADADFNVRGENEYDSGLRWESEREFASLLIIKVKKQ